jgi:hypothetical protein
MGGISELADRLDIDTAPNAIAGREIAFDAADNIHYVGNG